MKLLYCIAAVGVASSGPGLAMAQDAPGLCPAGFHREDADGCARWVDWSPAVGAIDAVVHGALGTFVASRGGVDRRTAEGSWVREVTTDESGAALVDVGDALVWVGPSGRVRVRRGDTWSTGSDLPAAGRAERMVAARLDHGHLLTGTGWTYNALTDAWSRRRRAGDSARAACAIDEGSAALIGDDSVWVHGPGRRIRRWALPASEAAVACTPEGVIATGGRTAGMARRDSARLTTRGWRPIAPMQVARVGHALLGLGGDRVLAVGGDPVRVEVYRDGQWSLVAGPPGFRNPQGAAHAGVAVMADADRVWAYEHLSMPAPPPLLPLDEAAWRRLERRAHGED